MSSLILYKKKVLLTSYKYELFLILLTYSKVIMIPYNRGSKLMGHKVDPYLSLDKIGKSSSIIIFIIISYLFNCTF